MKTQNVLYFVLDQLLKLFHPFIPFVTEYIYQEMPNHEETIMLTKFPTKLKIKGLNNNFDEVIDIIKSIRNARAEFNVPDNKRTSIYVMVEGDDKLVKDNLFEIAKLAYGTECKIIEEEPKEKNIKIISNNVKIYIPMGQLVDFEKEKERLNKEIDSVKFEISRSEKMLANTGFVAKAPEALVAKEKEKLEANKVMLNKLLKELETL